MNRMDTKCLAAALCGCVLAGCLSGCGPSVEALRNPAPVTAVAGDGELTAEERRAMAEAYAPFGLTYDGQEDQWYYNGEAVRFLRDVLISNGKSLTGGEFRGVIRTLSGERGTLRVETVRDYTRPDALGYGTLTAVRPLEDL